MRRISLILLAIPATTATSVRFTNPDPCAVFCATVRGACGSRGSACHRDTHCENLYWKSASHSEAVPICNSEDKDCPRELKAGCEDVLKFILQPGLILKAPKAPLIKATQPSGVEGWVASKAAPGMTILSRSSASGNSVEVRKPTSTAPKAAIVSAAPPPAVTTPKKAFVAAAPRPAEAIVWAAQRPAGATVAVAPCPAKLEVPASAAPPAAGKKKPATKKNSSRAVPPEEDEEAALLARAVALSLEGVSEDVRLESIRSRWFPKDRPDIIPMNRLDPKLAAELAKLKTEKERMSFFVRHVDVLTAPEYDIDPLPGRRGFVNIGNTCYFNALIQALGHSTYFREVVHSAFIPKVLNQRESALFSFLSIIDKAMMSEEEFGPIDPTRFFEKLRVEFPGNFIADEEEDLSLLFQTILEQLMAVDEPTVDRVFRMVNHNHDYCSICEYGSRHDESADYILKLPLPEGKERVTLEECFGEFSSYREIGDLDNYTCPRCGAGNYKRKPELGGLVNRGMVVGPQILIIQLTREESLPMVTFPEIFDLSSMPGSSRTSGIYNLVSVIHLSGRHYTTDFLDPIFHQWINANDMHVQAISPGMTFESNSVYALVYELING
jgi:ubiquitin C-terminal hydrolase